MEISDCHPPDDQNVWLGASNGLFNWRTATSRAQGYDYSILMEHGEYQSQCSHSDHYNHFDVCDIRAFASLLLNNSGLMSYFGGSDISYETAIDRYLHCLTHLAGLRTLSFLASTVCHMLQLLNR